jgi:hypothetical protein
LFVRHRSEDKIFQITIPPMGYRFHIFAPFFFLAALLVVCPLGLQAEDRAPEEVLNIDFNGTDSGQISPTFAGAGPLGGGVFWNGVNASTHAENGVKAWSGLLYSDGQTESDVQITARDIMGVMTMLSGTDGAPTPIHNNALLVDMISTTRSSGIPGELSISGLKPNTSYDLVLYGRASNVGTKFTVDGVSLETSGIGAGDPPLEEGRDYVRFPSISSGDSGEIIFTAEGTGSGAHLAGLSLAPSK